MSVPRVDRWAPADEIPEVYVDRKDASSYAMDSGRRDGDFIVLPGNGVSLTESAADLFPKLARLGRLFYRGGAVVELKRMTSDQLELAIVVPAAFRSRIETAGRVVAWRSGANNEPVLKETVCPKDTAEALLACSVSAEHLPPIASVVNCPICVETAGGLKILAQGYHREHGGILVTGGEVPVDVDLEEAVAELRSLLDGFDFQSDGDRSRALAQLITPALKMGALLAGFIPVDVAEADQSQSGKTYRQRLTAALYNEQPRLIAKRDGGVGSVDESFSQALLAGRPFIQLDNFRGKLDSQFIESFLTATGGFAARVPHRGDVIVDPSRFTILLTSNGVETSEDMANRSCIVRIRKRVGYAFRQYPEGDLLAHVRSHQSHYLGCIFSVIRRWVEAGKPRTDTNEHDFRDWAQILDWIAQRIFGGAPLLEGHHNAQKRVSNPALNFLRKIALQAKQNSRLQSEMSASAIFDLALEHEIEIPGVSNAEEQQAKRHIGILMARVFKTGNSVHVDGFEVRRVEHERRRDDGGGNHMVKFYIFGEPGAEFRTGAQDAPTN